MSQIRKNIINESTKQSGEKRSHGLIGHVIRYHPESMICDCDEHGQLKPMEESERHTVDVRVQISEREQVLKRVPCMVYSHGIISNGLVVNDRVWIEYINGDPDMPVVTAFYREPSYFKVYANTLRYSMANIFDFFGG